MSSARQKAQERHSEAYWRGWAIRLLSLWVLLSLLLVGLRVQTSDIRSTLLDTQEASQLLVVERDGLSMEVQTLQSASRITAWAEEQDMLRFADSLKRSAEISGVSLPSLRRPLRRSWRCAPNGVPLHPPPQEKNPVEIKMRNRARLMYLLAAFIFLSLTWGYAQLEWSMPKSLSRQVVQGRGDILAADGTVMARSVDGERQYPQGALGGQVVGMMGTQEAWKALSTPIIRNWKAGRT
ncbi:hypothetical protein [Deinococcus radiophilus]|uniref:hypothetical protein n=1 Tax=Deinococcus radiophilus TaxID=32062 RepID=UPI0036239FEE